MSRFDFDVECTFDYNGERRTGSFRAFSGDRAVVTDDDFYTSLPATEILFDTQELENAKMAYLTAYKIVAEEFDVELKDLRSRYEPEANEEEAQALYNAELPLMTACQAKVAVLIKAFAAIACGY